MLAGVSCTSASACIPVDASGASGFAPFAEGWNGRSWSTEPVPTPAGVNNDPLLATSCTSRRMYRGRLLLQPHYWWCLDPGRALLVIRAFARRGRPSRTETWESERAEPSPATRLMLSDARAQLTVIAAGGDQPEALPLLIFRSRARK
jgi:hypothetical protein